MCLHYYIMHYYFEENADSYCEWLMETFLLHHSKDSSQWENSFPISLLRCFFSRLARRCHLVKKAISIDNIKSPKLQRYYESKGVKSHPSASLTSPVRRCTYSTCLPPPSSPPSTVAWALLFLSAPVPTLPLVLSVPHAVLPTLWSDTRWWTQSLKGSPSGCYSL